MYHDVRMIFLPQTDHCLKTGTEHFFLSHASVKSGG